LKENHKEGRFLEAWTQGIDKDGGVWSKRERSFEKARLPEGNGRHGLSGQMSKEG